MNIPFFGTADFLTDGSTGLAGAEDIRHIFRTLFPTSPPTPFIPGRWRCCPRRGTGSPSGTWSLNGRKTRRPCAGRRRTPRRPSDWTSGSWLYSWGTSRPWRCWPFGTTCGGTGARPGACRSAWTSATSGGAICLPWRCCGLPNGTDWTWPGCSGTLAGCLMRITLKW